MVRVTCVLSDGSPETRPTSPAAEFIYHPTAAGTLVDFDTWMSPVGGTPMQPFARFLILTFFCSTLMGQSSSTMKPSSNPPAAPTPLNSNLFDWDSLTVTPTAKGARRDVFDGPTTTLDKAHCHITTLNAGEKSGEPTRHLQEEIIIVKEGTVEANWDGQSKTGGPGSIIFFAAGTTTFLRNAGTTPCTYIVIYYYTPLTPES